MTRFNQPSEGTDNWHAPLNENFNDLGIEVINEVPTWSDLPATGEVSKSTSGQWPVYRVGADNVFVRVTDSAQEIVGGLGSANRPVPEQHVEKLSVNDADISRWYNVKGNTLADVKQAIANHNYIKLDPEVVYSGDTTVTIDVSQPREVVVEAYGAEIDYTGTGRAIDVAPNSYSGGNDRITWNGGYITGPGSGVNGTAGIYLEDALHHSFSLSLIEGFEYGIQVRNVDSFCENNKFDVPVIKRVSSGIRLEGATFTGGDGTDSFKSLQFHSSISQANIGFDMRDARVTADAKLDFVTFMNPGVTGWRVDGSLRGAEVNVNFDSAGTDGGTGVDLVSLRRHPGDMICTFSGVSTEFNDPNDIPFVHQRAEIGDVVYDRGTKLYETTADSHFGSRQYQRTRYRFGTAGSRTDWIQFRDGDGTTHGYFSKTPANDLAVYLPNSGQRFEVFNSADGVLADAKFGNITANQGEVKLGKNGARVFLDEGEIKVEDETGSITTIT
ncbi:hypothetical protein [Halobellus ruber]|uniref:Uncharacterized protein n=1 Tax=Halobellus ruber TaxID=2761102 RepID=A0A7J9SN92_9EURY|nr:hypothetical protein [Halobellus ruber]MBB6646611.1 hypothetical protein [Halobellus ruber]